VFHTFASIRAPYQPHFNGMPYAYSEEFTTPEEYFAHYPERTSCVVSQIHNGELVHNVVAHYSRSTGDTWFMAQYRDQLAKQRAETEADDSMAIARAKLAVVERAKTVAVVTAETHEPVPGENFRRLPRLPATVQAKR